MDIISKSLVGDLEPTVPCAEGCRSWRTGNRRSTSAGSRHSGGPTGTGELEFSCQTMSHLTTQFFRHAIHSQHPCSWKKRERLKAFAEGP